MFEVLLRNVARRELLSEVFLAEQGSSRWRVFLVDSPLEKLSFAATQTDLTAVPKSLKRFGWMA